MKILVFGGTTEGRELSLKLAALGHDVTVSVLTEHGVSSQGEHDGITVLSGAKPPEEIEEMLPGFGACVDATHPYATHIRESIRAACEKTGVPRFRLAREESEIADDGVSTVDSAEEAVLLLKDKTGNIMLTTGSKDLLTYKELGGERLYPRVLPLASSLEACSGAGIPAKNIMAMQGPFTREVNTALMKQFSIKFMVTKDSGRSGGFDEKMESAKEAGAELVLIKRPEDDGMTMEEILDEISGTGR